jgi:1-acyl-sn-glycerol-3-phosphate acyltransferase
MFGAIMYAIIWGILQPFRYLICRWAVSGLEHLPPRPEGFSLATNHIHWLDILVLGASMPLKYRPIWIAKIEIFENRFASWWFHQMGVVPIRRGKRDLTAMYAAEEVLKSGRPLVVFVEGHRSGNGALQEGRGGAVRLAARTKTCIVPVALMGTEVGPKTAVLRRTPISVRFGAAYHPDAPSGSIPFNRMNELTEEMMLRIAEMLPEERWGFYHDQMLHALTAETPA